MKCLVVGVVLFVTVVSCQAKQVCYGKYGCFTDADPFSRPLVPLPQHPDKLGTTYYLTTRQDPTGRMIINDHDVNRLQSSRYDGRKRTVIIVHGWMANTLQWVDEMRKALITKEDVNVIVAEWKEGAKEFYTVSVANTRLVGAQIAELIKFLNTNTKNTPASFHVIGFSLGGQIAGYVGRRLKKIKLGRITGLDPAGPYYQNTHIDVRLDPSDADFVDVIHTNAPFAGTLTQSGHLDFWPNGGMIQPGCGVSNAAGVIDAVKCHHFRAPNFYVDSILSKCQFRSYRCSTWSKFARGNCVSCGSSGCPEMGYNSIKYKGQPKGNYYLYTNGDRPFCVQRYALITFKTNSGWMADGKNPRIKIYGDKGNSGKIKLDGDMDAGSTEKFIAPIKYDIGALQSIDVWHSNHLAPLDGWRLNKVTVEHVDTKERFSACYGRWKMLFLIPQNKKLVKGDRC